MLTLQKKNDSSGAGTSISVIVAPFNNVVGRLVCLDGPGSYTSWELDVLQSLALQVGGWVMG